MKKRMPLPESERLRALLHYDQQTGVLTWRVQRPGGPRGKGCKPGSVAGMVKKRGHIEVKVDGVRYQAHRLIWKWMTGRDPVEDIDHRDLNPGNNAWANLREATPGQNAANRPCDPRSIVGLKGVTRTQARNGKWDGRYRAQITTPGGMRSLGRFDTAEEAHATWYAEYLKAYGEFGRKE